MVQRKSATRTKEEKRAVSLSALFTEKEARSRSFGIHPVYASSICMHISEITPFCSHFFFTPFVPLLIRRCCCGSVGFSTRDATIAQRWRERERESLLSFHFSPCIHPLYPAEKQEMPGIHSPAILYLLLPLVVCGHFFFTALHLTIATQNLGRARGCVLLARVRD